MVIWDYDAQDNRQFGDNVSTFRCFCRLPNLIWCVSLLIRFDDDHFQIIHIKAHMLHHEYNIFGISETWLHNLDDSNDLTIPGYLAPIRRDNNGHQGSVLVYMLVNAPAQHRQDLEPTNSEIIVVELQLKNTKVLICNCYRPPPPT